MRSYIPKLAKADKRRLGISPYTRAMERYSAGDAQEYFTIQSISKVISLAAALERFGFDKVLERMNMEPSGDPFNSLLDLVCDKPFNPMNNAGAITTAGYLVREVSFDDMLDYAGKLCLDEQISIDERERRGRKL